MSVLLDGQAIPAERAVAINRLRLKVERWTDLLLGRLLTRADVVEFAVEPDRRREFADDLRHEERTAGTEYIWSLTLTALGAFPPTAISTPSADLNARIAASILGCFPSDLFNSTGAFVHFGNCDWRPERPTPRGWWTNFDGPIPFPLACQLCSLAPIKRSHRGADSVRQTVLEACAYPRRVGMFSGMATRTWPSPPKSSVMSNR